MNQHCQSGQGRDSTSTVYREFFKDLGWELSSNLKKRCTSRPLGLKFHRITNNKSSLSKKEFYIEDEAIKKVEDHVINIFYQDLDN